VTEVVRVGVIGTGFGASTVAPAFAATHGCEVVDVVTPRDDAAVTELCARADVDVISVHSPPFLHLDHVSRAVAAGHAVHCDKPFGLDAEQAAAMTALAEDADVVHLVNFERRFDPGRERMRALVQDGAIGEPHHFQYSRHIAYPGRPWNWLYSRELGGGWLAGQGSHLIDCCRWMFGEIADAFAVTRTTVVERPGPDGQLVACDADDGFVASLRTETGVTAVIDCAIEAPVNTGEQTAVYGSTGALELDEGTILVRDAGGGIETVEVDLQQKVLLNLAMERWAARICEAVRTGVVEPGWPTFDDGLACAVVMDRMGRRAARA
jgi:predicted dehydrogenase